MIVHTVYGLMFPMVDEGSSKKLLRAQSPSFGRTFGSYYLGLMHACICFSCFSKMGIAFVFPLVARRGRAKSKIRNPGEQNEHLPLNILCLLLIFWFILGENINCIRVRGAGLRKQ